MRLSRLMPLLTVIVLTSCLTTSQRAHAEHESAVDGCRPRPASLRATTTEATTDTSAVSGVVYDTDSLTPLEFVLIMSGGRRQAVTGRDGQFRFVVAPTTKNTAIVLEIRRVGYEPRKETLLVPAERGVRASLYLGWSGICLAPVTTGI
jgi:hypothetical protein